MKTCGITCKTNTVLNSITIGYRTLMILQQTLTFNQLLLRHFVQEVNETQYPERAMIKHPTYLAWLPIQNNLAIKSNHFLLQDLLSVIRLEPPKGMLSGISKRVSSFLFGGGQTTEKRVSDERNQISHKTLYFCRNLFV